MLASKHARLFIGGLICAGMLTACDAPAPDSSKPPEPAGASNPETIARSVVAETLGIPISDVQIISAEPVEFSDSSLDCPAPDTAYMQVITPGHRIVAEGDGRRFDVRVSGTAGKICYQRKPIPPDARRGPESATSGLIDLAVDHLAAALNVDQNTISVADVQAYAGKVALSGCVPECDENPDGCGSVVRLQADSRLYTYYVNEKKATPCPAFATS